MPNRKLIVRKLKIIAEMLSLLQELAALPPLELFGNQRNFLLTERVLERMIGAAIDLNMHIVKDMGFLFPNDYRDSFKVLGKHGILDRPFAARISKSAGLRNLLVHEYEKIDERQLIKSIKSACKDYPKYVEAIEKLLR